MMPMSGPGLGRQPPAVGRAGDASSQEMAKALAESLKLQQNLRDPQPGTPVHPEDIQRGHLYYDPQRPGSDTCGLNALNNLCQRPMFQLSDLRQAEAAHAQAQVGGSFSQQISAHSAPTGFFDVEAIKLAAVAADLEIVDVEPVADYKKSSCLKFAESASTSVDGSWFLGFLVYDRRPGHVMHYYVLRRDERFSGTWLKLDSQVVTQGEEVRNRVMTDADLWAFYEASAAHFQAWNLRWYPVVFRTGAAREVRGELRTSGNFELGEERALRALREHGWLVHRTTEHLMHELPQVVIRELLVEFVRPSATEMRTVLEASKWDLDTAKPEIDALLRHRFDRAKGVDKDERPRKALSLCDWEPAPAATLLMLQLQMPDSKYELSELRQALDLAGNDVDRAEALLGLLPAVSSMQEAVTLLEQSKWSVRTAQRILEVRLRFPRASWNVAREVLRRNDDDPHAACEMLTEYTRRVRSVVSENATGDLAQNEVAAVGDAALSSTDWEPSAAFATAKELALNVQQTRQNLRARGCQGVFSVEAVLTALAAGDGKPAAAVSILLGVPPPPREAAPRQSQIPVLNSPVTRRVPESRGEEEEGCSLM